MSFYRTLILGMGNTLLTDEGAGIHGLKALQAKTGHLSELTFVDGGTLSFTLAALFEDCDNLIVLDAAQLNSSAGTVKSFVNAEMDQFLGSAKRSAHEVGLMDLMDIARLTETLPRNRALIAIQPKTIDWGMRPTPIVEQGLEQLVDQALNLINQWRSAEPEKIVLNTAKYFRAKDAFRSQPSSPSRTVGD